MNGRLRQPFKHKGQAMVEMVLTYILFMVILSLISTASMYLYLQHSIANAAREGARIGSVNQDFEDGDDATGIQTVEDTITNFMQQTTGQVLTADNSVITVTPPSESPNPVGERTIEVGVQYHLDNPIPIADFLAFYCHCEDYAFLDSIPVTGKAVMRFEE